MKTIFKTKLELIDFQIIKIPNGAKFLTAQLQDNALCVWYECNTDAGLGERRIAIIGTGQELPPHRTYVASVQWNLPSSLYIWHIYEVENLGK